MNPTSTKPKSSSTTTTTTVSSSYDVFNAVDSLVSKPVYGSDGASRWQDFNSTKSNTSTNTTIIKHTDNAPKAPLKAIDRLNGFTSWNDERQNEQLLRSETMNGTNTVGYTNFKRKNNNSNNKTTETSSSSITSAESVSVSNNTNINNNDNKRKIQQQQQQNSDDLDNDDINNTIDATKIQSSLVVDNFIPSKHYIGAKVGYIYTTRQPSGTGYYLDTKVVVAQQQKQQGGNIITNIESNTMLPNTDNVDVNKTKKKKKQLPVIINDPMNPLEQIAAAIERKNLLLQKQQQHQYQFQHKNQQILPQQQQNHQNDDNDNVKDDSFNLPIGWFSTIDPTTKRIYYYNPTTSERCWNKPTSTNTTSTMSQGSNIATPVATIPETTLPTTITTTATTTSTTTSTGTSTTTGATLQEEKTEENGWYSTIDPVTNKYYWYNIHTKATIWR